MRTSRVFAASAALGLILGPAVATASATTAAAAVAPKPCANGIPNRPELERTVVGFADRDRVELLTSSSA